MSTPPPPSQPDDGSLVSVLDAWVLFGTLVALLAAFLAGLLLIQAIRRRRLRDRPKPPATELPDAWAESARRLKS